MNDRKYVLIVFNEPEDVELNIPREVKVIKQVASAEVRGASCGVINLSFFQSEMELDEISNLFKKEKIKFLLFEEKNSSHDLPNYITRMFGKDFEKTAKVLYDSHDSKKDIKKLSLEDQLAEAVSNEEFAIAAKLRDRIAKEATSGTNPLKELFKKI